MSKNKRKGIHDHWATPDYITSWVLENYGPYFDPCPLFSTFDGLNIPWKSVNFINPPYTRKIKEAFIKKALYESRLGETLYSIITCEH